MNRALRFMTLVTIVLLIATSAVAQTTASLTGTVTTDGNPLPGVTVTVSSPQLQGTRTTVSGEGGAYNFPALPPGEYTVQFELSGMERVTRTTRLNLGQTSRVDAAMRVSGVAEAITVTASAPSVLETPQVASTMTLTEVERLPVPRNQLATALLAPGVNGNTFSGSQLSISGSPGYDNLVLVNGVVVTENVRSQMRPLYIEDAIQETTVMTGAISAEYGRFTGGVVNTITKSGGNEFSGSIRDNLSNAAWSEPTAFVSQAGVRDTRPASNLNQIWEATLGGYILRDRLWFFTAGRHSEVAGEGQTASIPGRTTAPASPASPNLTYATSSNNRRIEGKLTGNITNKHSVVGSYLDIKAEATGDAFTTIYDLESLTDRSDPESLLSVHYTGVLTSNLMLEAQYSQREQAFVGNGSKFTDLIRGTILLDRNNASVRFNSPTFCGVCDTETRNNDEILIKSNYFLNTRALGSHNIVAGVDRFQEQRYANNFQSGSDFRLFVTRAQYNNGVIYPVVTPTTSTGAGTFIRWTPIFVGADENNLRTDSLFINDKWDLTRNLSFNIGLRYDRNNAKDANGFVSSDDSKITPRLTAIYDVRGDGRHRVNLSYNQYASRIVEGVATGAQSAGQPAAIDFVYTGPAINANALEVPMHEVIARVFQHFNTQQGGTANTAVSNLLPGGLRSVPGFGSYYEDSLVSPTANEWNLGYGMAVGANGFLKVDYIRRDWTNFYVGQIRQDTRRVVTPLGIRVDQTLITNSDRVKREYRGWQLQARWNPSRFQTGLNYTWSTLRGNAEVEDATSGPGAVADPGNFYPEWLNYANRQPMGYLAGDQRHRARAWVGYDVPLPEVIGRLNLSVLQNFDSGLPYSIAGTIGVANYPGAPTAASLPYTNPQTSGTYFFSERGEFRLPDVSSTNLAVRYSRNLFRGAQFFAQGDLLNVFNRQSVVGNINTTVRTAQTSANTDFATGNRLQPFNPFTDQPVEGVHYSIDRRPHSEPGVQFGELQGRSSFQTPRTYRFSLGLRF